MITEIEALEYHKKDRRGKIEVVPSKDFQTQKDISLAYTPGVAFPSLAISKNEDDSYNYTSRSNLIAVVSNGTAVLGLGNIGPSAAKPVMEGKALLFKIFADIDAFDIEINENNPKKLIEIVKSLEPTFGAINLEDIKSPECFEVEDSLKKAINIPVFHDDQHGTAIIAGAGLINALKLVKKKIENVKIVVCGAGAAGFTCAKYFSLLGANKKNITICDINGVVRKDNCSNPRLLSFATERNIFSLADAMKDADVFLGVSAANIVSADMLKSMNDNPIVFAMANPNPEINPELALASRDDIIFATGRSDYPNQINNVLGFPFIFRAALDVRASDINDEMKIAATYALADLAFKKVPKYVCEAYNKKEIKFGKDYLIPKPLDLRLIEYVSVAVAKAAIKSGVAKIIIEDWDKYRISLRKRIKRVNINYRRTI